MWSPFSSLLHPQALTLLPLLHDQDQVVLQGACFQQACPCHTGSMWCDWQSCARTHTASTPSSALVWVVEDDARDDLPRDDTRDVLVELLLCHLDSGIGKSQWCTFADEPH